MGSDLLRSIDHRPWPLPERPFAMHMRWHALLFAHWPVGPSSRDALRSRIPPGLTLQTFDGAAWLGIVPFRMSDVRPRGVPPLPVLSRFPELNVRTYVTDGRRAGVWFLSLDAASRMAVRAARRFFHLPYFDAEMDCRTLRGEVLYRSERTHRGAPAARFEGRYAPLDPAAAPPPGSLEEFLTERYCLYAAHPDGRLMRGDVHHRPWPLQRARAEISVNTMAAAHGLALPDVPPLCHYAHELDVVGWRLVEVGAER